MKNQKLINIEKKFNLAETLVEELDSCINEIEITDLVKIENITDNTETVLNMNQLKQDFGMIRSNVIKLVATGQRILDQASSLDLSDMKPSQLEALSNLQSTLGNNIKLMMEIYKDIASIEKSRQKPIPKTNEQNASVNGNINNTNIVFTGNSSELLSLINNSVKEIINV